MQRGEGWRLPSVEFKESPQSTWPGSCSFYFQIKPPKLLPTKSGQSVLGVGRFERKAEHRMRLHRTCPVGLDEKGGKGIPPRSEMRQELQPHNGVLILTLVIVGYPSCLPPTNAPQADIPHSPTRTHSQPSRHALLGTAQLQKDSILITYPLIHL